MVGGVRDPFLGTVLDRRYRIEERIAAGGFGAIYRAVHERSAMQLAIKVLHPRLSADHRIVARFRREGATLTSLRSPHTVTTYELAEDPNGTLFIVMELLEGQTLLERFTQTGPMPWRSVLAMGRSICDALGEAHALGVVHRDLKPANIHLSHRDGEPNFIKVLDFGIAKLLTGSGIEDQSGEELTNHNEVIGTFEYVSPEQIAGSEYSGRSDLYTLGVVMYEMITGSRPFGKLTGPAMMATIFSDVAAPPSSRLPGLPPELDAMLVRLLHRDPDDRYADVGALVEAIDALVGRDPTGEAATIAATPLDLSRLDEETPAPATVRREGGGIGVMPPRPVPEDADSMITPYVPMRSPTPRAQTPRAQTPRESVRDVLRDVSRDSQRDASRDSMHEPTRERDASRDSMREPTRDLGRDHRELLGGNRASQRDLRERESEPTLGAEGRTVRKVPPPPSANQPGPRVRAPTVQPGSPQPRPSQPPNQVPRPSQPANQLPLPARPSQPPNQLPLPARPSQPAGLPPPRPRSPSVGLAAGGLAPPPPVAVGLVAPAGPPASSTLQGHGGAPQRASSPALLPPPDRASNRPGSFGVAQVPSTQFGVGPQHFMPPRPATEPPVPPVFATLEGWQAPRNLPAVQVVKSPAVIAAERERKILIVAAVFGIAILIGVILAVAV